MKKRLFILILIFNLIMLFPICTVNAGSTTDDIDYSELDIPTEFEEEKIADCNSLLGNPKDSTNRPPAFYLQKIFSVMKYAGIILVVVLSTFDFIASSASKDEDKLKKTVNKLIIRLVICIVIFLIPSLLQYIFTLIDVYSPSICNLN